MTFRKRCPKAEDGRFPQAGPEIRYPLGFPLDPEVKLRFHFAPGTELYSLTLDPPGVAI